jgi:hypothetical protein
MKRVYNSFLLTFMLLLISLPGAYAQELNGIKEGRSLVSNGQLGRVAASFAEGRNQVPAKAAKRQDPITTPLGTARDYSLTEFYFRNTYRQGWLSGYADKVYFDGNDVYFKDLVYLVADGTYVKGTITSGDSHNGVITIPNMQYCSSSCRAAIATVNSNGSLIVDTTAAAFQFTIKDDTITSNAVDATGGHMYILAINDDDEIQCYSAAHEYEPVDEAAMTEITMPQNVTAQKYRYVCQQVQPTEAYAMDNAKVAIDGTDCYISGLVDADTSLCIKGTIAGDSIVFALPEYLGKRNNAYTYLRAGELYWDTDPDTGEEARYYRILYGKDKVVFSYDKASGKMKCNDFLIITSGKATTLSYLNEPTLTVFDYQMVTVPDSATVKDYLLSVEQETGNGRTSSKIRVAQDGDDFYFMDLYRYCPDFAFKGTRRGDSIYVDFPQYVGQYRGSDCFMNAGFLQTMDYYGYKYYFYHVSPDVTSVRMAYDEATSTISCDTILVMSDQTGSVGGDFYKPVYSPFNYEVAVVPDGAEEMDYVLYNHDLDGTEQTPKLVNIARAGDDFYFLNHEDDTSILFKGTLKDGRLSVEVPQYVGGSRIDFIHGADVVKTLDEDGDTVTELAHIDSLTEVTFVYDEATKTLSTDRALVMMDINGHQVDLFCAPVYKLYVAKAATPADPEIVSWEYNESYNQYKFMVKIPNKDVNGDYIDPEGISYRVYFDDQPYTFTTALYPSDFDVDTEVIPFAFTCSDITDEYGEPTVRKIWLNEKPETKIGIQSAFTYDGTTNWSNVVSYDIVTTGISVSSDARVVATDYYDLSGRRVDAHAQGIVIVKTRFSDGTARVSKRVK